jgi:hypothetical protein
LLPLSSRLDVSSDRRYAGLGDLAYMLRLTRCGARGLLALGAASRRLFAGGFSLR